MQILVKTRFIAILWVLCLLPLSATAQALGTAGTISGVVEDPNGANVPNANVVISNAVTGYSRTATSDAQGNFRFNNVPPNVYTLTASASGFNLATQNLSVRGSVPVTVNFALTIAGATQTVNVTDQESNSVLENVPTTHTDVDQTLINRLPLDSPGSGLSEVITLSAPGVVADSNGFFHPLGDHAQTSYSVDNQPISDQQSKAFSTQLPPNTVQSLEIITGATPAEYGDKTSLVVNAITKSGLNQTKPSGNVNTSYGSFNTVSTDGALAYGNAKAGNFVAVTLERSNRFLDPPEFRALHDRGNSINLFDRVDYSPTQKDTVHLNLFYARNNFQIPNQYDQDAIGQDQRQRVQSFDIAPGYVHIFSPQTVLTINPYFRVDQVKYRPSADAFSDQPISFSQSRRLADLGARADLSYVKGIHNAKFGVQLQHHALNEGFDFAITDPNFNAPENDSFLPGLLPFDLTRGGRYFNFFGRANINQQAVYAQDTISYKNLTVNAGLRFDNYHGLSRGKSLQPRLGASYLFKQTGTILRASYTRNFETPYNENLVFSNAAGTNGFADGSFGNATSAPLKPGNRNQVNFGFQQSVTKYVLVDVDYFNKNTTNAYDFNTLFNTPVTFPISWSKSKIDGVSARVNLTPYKNFSAFFVAGHTRARFFPPESGGFFFNSDLPTGAFRIDHDQAFQQTTQVQYQFNQLKRIAPYVNFTWRYDSGLVSGAVSDYETALSFTADQQAQIGLFCGNLVATPFSPIATCADSNRGARRVRIPSDGTANDDTNPPRIAPRSIFDLSAGTDNLFGGEKTKVTLRFTASNLTNKVALYNFLSTFSGTHFIAPRSFQGQIGITF